jgi:hypothetical protein
MRHQAQERQADNRSARTPGGPTRGPNALSGADSSGSMRNTRPRQHHPAIGSRKPKTPEIQGLGSSGGPRSRTSRCGFGDRLVWSFRPVFAGSGSRRDHCRDQTGSRPAARRSGSRPVRIPVDRLTVYLRLGLDMTTHALLAALRRFQIVSTSGRRGSTAFRQRSRASASALQPSA